MTGTNKEIVVIILHDGFRLDWQETQEPLEDGQYSIQNQLFEQWRGNPYKALFSLGFRQIPVPVSDSLQFLKNISDTFIKSLSRQPDIEFLREKTTVEPEEENQNIINAAPFMNGLKYLDSQWINNIRGKLLEVFREEIHDYRGSVAEYFASLNPIVHVMGRDFSISLRTKRTSTLLLLWLPIHLRFHPMEGQSTCRTGRPLSLYVIALTGQPSITFASFSASNVLPRSFTQALLPCISNASG